MWQRRRASFEMVIKVGGMKGLNLKFNCNRRGPLSTAAQSWPLFVLLNKHYKWINALSSCKCARPHHAQCFFFLFPGEIIHVSAFSRLPAGVETWASVWNKSEDWRIEGRKIRLCLVFFFFVQVSTHSYWDLWILVSPQSCAHFKNKNLHLKLELQHRLLATILNLCGTLTLHWSFRPVLAVKGCRENKWRDVKELWRAV